MLIDERRHVMCKRLRALLAGFVCLWLSPRRLGDLVHFVKTLHGGVPLETDDPLELSDISLSARQADLADVGVLERSVRTLHGALVGDVSCRRSNVHISERVVSPRRAVVALDILFLSVFGRCS